MSKEGWYYADQGARHGPFTDWEIAQFGSSGKIQPDTIVWCAGMAEWQPIRTTPLGEEVFGRRAAEPPSLPTAHINNTLAWSLATAPFWVPFNTSLLVGAIYSDTPYLAPLALHQVFSSTGFWICCVVINWMLCGWDSSRLHAAGHKQVTAAWAWLVPVYLYQRAQKLRQPLHYFIAWCVCFALSFFLF